MSLLFFYGSVIAAMVLYGNTLSAMKNINDNKDIETNLIVGCICAGFIMFSIYWICGR